MNKVKILIYIETIVIIILAFILFKISYLDHASPSRQEAYCEKHYYDSSVCLLSPRVYTGIINPNNFLILNFKPLKEDLQNYINKSHLNLSIYIVNLRDGGSFGVNGEESYPAASLNKLATAVIILKKIEKGEMSLDTKFPITDAYRDPSSGTLYKNPVNELSVKELLYYMLSESDNTALWVLQEKVDKEDLVNLANYIDFYARDIASQTPIVNDTSTTPKQISNIFLSLYLSTALNPEHSELILSDLSNSSFNIRGYASLPSTAVVAQKDAFQYAQNRKFFHDCGILYVDDSRFSYCIMTKDIDLEEAPKVIGVIVNKLYRFILEGRKVKDLPV